VKLAIIVPVHYRPAAAAPFCQSLYESLRDDPNRVPHTDSDPFLVVPATMGDMETAEAWEKCGVFTPYNTEASFPHKVQWAYDQLKAEDVNPEFVLVIGDDVRFHDGWYTAFLESAKDLEAGLISTNDMGNPYVMAGTHATHPIFRSSYIDDVGASWDGPGTVVHTGYRHMFVDEEWSTRAKFEGVFRYSPDCKIEHLHPTWGKGAFDGTYAVARQALQDDHDLYVRRFDTAHQQGIA
jgi:hypothetical protein